MAIAEIGKLNLIAMSYEKDAVLNALQRTGATEIKLLKETENTAPMIKNTGLLPECLAYFESALEYLSNEVENYNKENKIKNNEHSDDLTVNYSEFIKAGELKAEAEGLAAEILRLRDEKRSIRSEINGIEREINSAEIFCAVKAPFNTFKNTQHVKVKLGAVPAAAVDALSEWNKSADLAVIKTVNKTLDGAVILIAYHKSFAQAAEEALTSFGFTACPYAEDSRSGEEVLRDLNEKKQEYKKKAQATDGGLIALADKIKTLKIYCDYLSFELEKAELSDKMRQTQTTFLLEAYVPVDAQSLVAEALNGVSSAVYYEFTETDKDEVPPTLYKNNAVVKNFEAITNMYSPANYREFDPNTIMAVFYSIFLGFIMGDIGYGLLMFFGGGFVYLKNRGKDSGLKRLAGVFAIGGICAIVWGVLFNSFFGINLKFMSAVMPDAQKDMWTFMGISVPAVLVISLEIGIVQLFAGYICKAVQFWRRKKIWDGIWEGVTWALFSLGVAIAIVGLIGEADTPLLAYIGGGIAAVSLLAAVLTAGRHEKVLGKFTKGFGAAYGVINYASDILSYARLYGLMLSGAVIAQIVSKYAVQFVTGGNPALIILGILIMVIGHLFNLAMGLLGAYIHDARLQYVEFYGRFYEGEGELFKPLGSEHKYISLNK